MLLDRKKPPRANRGRLQYRSRRRTADQHRTAHKSTKPAANSHPSNSPRLDHRWRHEACPPVKIAARSQSDQKDDQSTGDAQDRLFHQKSRQELVQFRFHKAWPPSRRCQMGKKNNQLARNGSRGTSAGGAVPTEPQTPSLGSDGFHLSPCLGYSRAAFMQISISSFPG